MEVFRLENVSFSYPKSGRKALNNISLTVDSGEFVILCGKTGCSKTTLLKMLKPELTPVGELNGKILFGGTPLSELKNEISARKIGFVMQKPENQTVTDYVWHELSFGLENLCVGKQTIRARVAETASYFGISDWFNKKTSDLSGGQKQLLNLASIMALEPEVLLLDEPTAQLDPIAKQTFMDMLKKIHGEIGTTVIMAEHSLENCFSYADKIIAMDGGQITVCGTPSASAKELIKTDLLPALPIGARLYRELGSNGETIPFSVNESKKYITDNYKTDYTRIDVKATSVGKENALSLNNVSFRYSKDSDDVLNNLSLDVKVGESLCLLGANASGKSTLLNVMSGVLPPYSGKIKVNGKNIKSYKNGLYGKIMSILPQDTELLFLMENVRDDLEETCMSAGVDKSRVDLVASELGITHILASHPYDLSGGEQQKAAFAKLLLIDPMIYLLDEPTKGLDALSKAEIVGIIKKLKEKGKTVITVTHDTDFAYKIADSVALLFNGEIITKQAPNEFFKNNSYFTTSARRLTKGLFENTVSDSEIVELCLKNGRK